MHCGSGAVLFSCVVHCGSDAVLFIVFIPVRVESMPAALGDVANRLNLAIALYILVRRVWTQLRRNLTYHAILVTDGMEILSCLMPWIALPFRHSQTLETHRMILGFASALGWMRFMQDSFKFSQTLGPLVLMVKTMIFVRLCSQTGRLTLTPTPDPKPDPDPYP